MSRIEKVLTLHRNLDGHLPDLALGLDRLNDPRVLPEALALARRLHAADKPAFRNKKLRLDPAVDLQLTGLHDAQPDSHLYLLVTSACLIVRGLPLAPTYGKRQPLLIDLAS